MFEVIIMSRQKRQLSKNGLYHIICRGISRQNIFEESSDYIKLKDIIRKVLNQTEAELYAFCFMTNHIHLFLKENKPGDISKIMAKILSHYATWFNIKYMRSGALFSNRYKSEPIEDERYYLTLIRYIHQNPVKAGMVASVDEYPYTSYDEYISGSGDIATINFTLDMLNENKKLAIEQFRDFHKSEETEVYEINDSRRKSPELIRRIIMSELSGDEPAALKSYNKEKRNAIIRKLVFETQIPKSALERATGISRGTIIRICQNTVTESTTASERTEPTPPAKKQNTISYVLL